MGDDDHSGTSGGEATSHLWGERFAESPDATLERVNRSLPVDWRLWPYELRVNRAWIDELAAIGHLAPDQADTLRRGLDEVAARLRQGDPAGEPDEDIHTLIERLLREAVGEVASMVRLGRSRNDVVATDLRLWALDACDGTVRGVRRLQEALIGAAERAVDHVLPGYSHLQQAQPTRAAHWLLSFFWPLQRDVERIRQIRARTARSPLGAAAGFGSGLPVDRARLAERLRLAAPCENTLDAVGSREWAAELLYAWSQLAVDLSRLSEDLVVYSSAEFRLVRLADSYTTGSSLMPHKRNPDGAELARARAGALIGRAAGFLATLKGLPSGYNKDLQLDKEHLFDAEAHVAELLALMAGTVETLRTLPEAASHVDPQTLAADVAERLATGGVPFREAHGIAGRLVRKAEESGVSPAALSREELEAVDPRLADLDAEFWDVAAAVERRAVLGGTSRAAVEEQLAAARRALEREEADG